jgi:enamine deaminase RidA (YjgF/YER057c/UK114 family)
MVSNRSSDRPSIRTRGNYSAQVIRHFGQWWSTSGVPQMKQSAARVGDASAIGDTGAVGKGGGGTDGGGSGVGAGSDGLGGVSSGGGVGSGGVGAGSSAVAAGSSFFSLRNRRNRRTIPLREARRNFTLRVALGPRTSGARAPSPAEALGPTRMARDVNGSPSQRLKDLGLTLPPPPKPAGAYSPVVIDGSQAWVSGQIVLRDGAILQPGLVDRDVSLDAARELARLAVLQALSALAAALGSIDRIQRVLRVGVYVASTPTFTRQHEVGNGATELLVALFGDAGRPARTSMGVAALPLNAAVEVEMVVAVTVS